MGDWLEPGAIREILPHGPSMVLIDRAEVLQPGRSLRAFKAITCSELCYQHLPAGLARRRYAYPVSLILESFGQAAAVLWHSRSGSLVDDDGLLMFAAARNCRFESRAYPGEVLRHEVSLDPPVANTGFASGETWAGGRLVATLGSFVAVVRPAGQVLAMADPEQM